MALPIYKHPIYTTKLPSNGKEIKYRPFLVKDEKNLLLAQQSEEELTMIDTVKSVIQDCIVDKKINLDELPIFDIEWLFCELRVKSVGEEVSLFFTCRNDACAEKTKATFKISPTISKSENHTNKIDLYDNVGIVMKYADPILLKKMLQMNESDPNQVLKIIAGSIESIYDSESVYPAKDQTEEELIKFIEALPRNCADKIKTFFESIPKLVQKVSVVCPKCETDNHYIVEGIENFF
jgi:hypothetical protein